MEPLEQQHHAEDVGRILLQTQEHVRALRQQMTAAAAAVEAAAATRPGPSHVSNGSGSGVAAADVQAFDAILQRAERELQAKAELVLHGLVRASASVYSPTHAPQLPPVDAPPPVRRRDRPTDDHDDHDGHDLAYFRSVRRPLPSNAVYRPEHHR